MVLPNVGLDDPHVSAHNSERAAINALETNAQTKAGLDAAVAALLNNLASVTSLADKARVSLLVENEDFEPTGTWAFVEAPSVAGSSLQTSAQQAAAIAAAVLVTVSSSPTTTAYTFVLADAGKVVEHSHASPSTLTVPPNTSVAYPIGTVIEVVQRGAGQITLAPGVGVSFEARGNALKIAGQYGVASLRKRATNVWSVTGDLTT